MSSYAPAGRHRRSCLVVPAPPDDTEKASYAARSLPYLTTALTISLVFVVLAQVLFEARNLEVAWPFAFYTLMYFVYQAVSLPINFAGRSFDLDAHVSRVAAWQPGSYPSVDIFLPICGEPLEVLRNTWIGVFELLNAYPGRSRRSCSMTGPVTGTHGRSPGPSDSPTCAVPTCAPQEVGQPRLRASRHTRGEHVVIFDADFRPRPDFLAETLPYMDDPVGRARPDPAVLPGQPGADLGRARGGRDARGVLPGRRRSRGTGSARRCASAPTPCTGGRRSSRLGGFTEIPYAEDSHTGLDMRYAGYEPGLPAGAAGGRNLPRRRIDAFMRQQYRWCCGATSLVWTQHMWRVRCPGQSRLPYIAGWLWNFTTGAAHPDPAADPDHACWCSFPARSQLRNALLLVPAVVTSRSCTRSGTTRADSPRIWPLTIAVGWAQVLAIWDYARGKVMSWQPSRGPRTPPAGSGGRSPCGTAPLPSPG